MIIIPIYVKLPEGTPGAILKFISIAPKARIVSTFETRDIRHLGPSFWAFP